MPKTIICEYCGAECTDQDEYCPKCLKRMPEEQLDKSNIIDGMSEHRLHVFIEKKSDRYVNIFKRNEGKRAFVSFNFASFFFGSNWMVYRKMYFEAALCCALSFFTTLISTVCFALPYQAELTRIKEIRNSLDTFLFNDATYSYEQIAEAIKRQQEIRATVSLYSSATVLVLFSLVCGLFGDAIYKNYVKKNINRLDSGGTSVVAVIVAFFIMAGVRLITDPIATGILNLFT